MPPSHSSGLSHLSQSGELHMVDVSQKPVVVREAVAEGKILLAPATLEKVRADGIAKGNVLAAARLAGIQAAKQTSNLIPLCHTLLLEQVELSFALESDGIHIRSSVRMTGKTGAEMEALMAVSVAGLTIYDMCKAVDKGMQLTAVRLVSKQKGAA